VSRTGVGVPFPTTRGQPRSIDTGNVCLIGAGPSFRQALMKCLAFFLAATSLAGCATFSLDLEGPPALCGKGAQGQWTLASEPPASAPALRALADSSPNFPAGKMTFPIEHWFVDSGGGHMLCRRDTSSCSGEWWQFQRDNDTLTVSRQDAWICVAGAGPDKSFKATSLRDAP
jgi:hypothetical protein